jgi:hypothetical protein
VSLVANLLIEFHLNFGGLEGRVVHFLRNYSLSLIQADSLNVKRDGGKKDRREEVSCEFFCDEEISEIFEFSKTKPVNYKNFDT